MQRKYFIFCYDVSSPSLSRKALLKAREFSVREQESCFECFMTDLEVENLKSWISENFKPTDKASILEIHDYENAFRVGPHSDLSPFILV